MPVIPIQKQSRWMHLFVFPLLFSMTVTACSSNVTSDTTPKINNTPTKKNTDNNTSPDKNTDKNNTLVNPSTQNDRVRRIPGEEAWTTLSRGQEAYGLTFTKDGKLSYQGNVLLSSIPVTYRSDGKVFYADRLIVSPPSSSGNFHFFKGCEPPEQGELCWALFFVDKQKGKADKTVAGKYSPLQWIQWTKDERYALLADNNERYWRLYAIDMQTGDSKQFEIGSRTVDLNSFLWISDRAFKVKVIDGSASPDSQTGTEKSSWFKGNIEDVFKK